MQARRLATFCSAAALAVAARATPALQPIHAQAAPAAPGLCRTDPAAAVHAALGNLPYGIALRHTDIAGLVRAHGGTQRNLGATDAIWVDTTSNVEVRFRHGIAFSVTLRGRGPADWDATLGECLNGHTDWATNYATAAKIFSAIGSAMRGASPQSCSAMRGPEIKHGFSIASRSGDVIVELTQRDAVGCGDAYFAWSISVPPSP